MFIKRDLGIKVKKPLRRYRDYEMPHEEAPGSPPAPPEKFEINLIRNFGNLIRHVPEQSARLKIPITPLDYKRYSTREKCHNPVLCTLLNKRVASAPFW